MNVIHTVNGCFQLYHLFLQRFLFLWSWFFFFQRIVFQCNFLFDSVLNTLISDFSDMTSSSLIASTALFNSSFGPASKVDFKFISTLNSSFAKKSLLFLTSRDSSSFLFSDSINFNWSSSALSLSRQFSIPFSFSSNLHFATISSLSQSSQSRADGNGCHEGRQSIIKLITGKAECLSKKARAFYTK